MEKLIKHKSPIQPKLNRGIANIIVKQTGFSAAYISDIFTGKVKLDRWSTGKKIASAVGIDPVFLLDAPLSKVIKKINKSQSPRG